MADVAQKPRFVRWSEEMAEFDWVSARSACSAAKVFHEIREGVESDVTKRNQQRRNEEGNYQFSCTAKGNYLIVSLGGQGVILNKRRKFILDADGVVNVEDDEGNVMLAAELTLNDNGDCRLKVNGQEKEFWQFRRMALEGLLFGPIFPL